MFSLTIWRIGSNIVLTLASVLACLSHFTGQVTLYFSIGPIGQVIRILHWLPVQTVISSLTVTLKGDNFAEFLLVTRELDIPICTHSQCLILFLADYMSIVFGTAITKSNIFITHCFLVIAYELTNFIHNSKMTSSLEHYWFIKGVNNDVIKSTQLVLHRGV
jgi:hypothetical protein